MDYIVPAEVNVAAGVLFDVLVLAGGPATRLAPLCGEAPKAVMPVCHMPLIWHCLRPWVEKGVRTFFVCVSQSESTDIIDKLRRTMPGIAFVEVLMLNTEGAPGDESDSEDTAGRVSNTSDAVKRFLEVKAGLLPKAEGRPRDVLLVSCDALIPGVDVQPFVSHFYTSRASVSVMLGKPTAAAAPLPAAAPAASVSGGKKGGGGGGKGKGGPADDQQRQTLTSLAESVWTFTTSELADGSDKPKRSGHAASTASPTFGAAGAALSPTSPEHLRLHFIDEELPEDISAGFAARRLNLVIQHDLIDVHIYLIRNWVARYVAETAGPDRKVQRDIIPLLAKSQFWNFNAETETCVGPDAKLKYDKKIPTHWSTDNESARSVRSLNAMQGTSPAAWDTLRVMCTVFTESIDQRLVRVNTKEKYLALAHEFTDFLAQLSAASSTGAAVAVPVMCRNIVDSALEDWRKLLEKNTNEFLPSRVRCSLLRSLPTHEKVSISRSVVGQNVVIGTDVVIENSVVMDGAEIGNGAKVRNSVVCARCLVPEGADITNAFRADMFSED